MNFPKHFKFLCIALSFSFAFSFNKLHNINFLPIKQNVSSLKQNLFTLTFTCVLSTLGAEVVYPSLAYAINPVELQQFAKPAGSSIDISLEEKLKRFQEAQNALDTADIPFSVLPSGVSYREYREGKGGKQVQLGSEVSAAMTIRCKTFATREQPGGVTYYSTAKDAGGNELTWVIGSGALPPGLEEGMLGMKRNSLRRIEVPSVQVYRAYKENQLPLPSKSNDDGNRRFKNLFKTDATLLFEVAVSKIRDPAAVASTSAGLDP